MLVLQCQNVLIFQSGFFERLPGRKKQEQRDVETIEFILSSPFYCFSGLRFVALSSAEHFLNEKHFTLLVCSFFFKSETAKLLFDKKEFP